MKLNQDQAVRIAQEWIEAWNRRDLASVLAHYTEDFEMSTPMIVKFNGEPSGTLTGKTQIEAYWRTALSMAPDLHFELVKVFVGAGSRVVEYKTSSGKIAAETFFINMEGKVTRALAHYWDEVQPFGGCERKLDRLDLRVRHLEETRLFYDQLMPMLGFSNCCVTSLGVVYASESFDPKPEFVGLIVDSAHEPCATRFASRASDKSSVDRVAEIAILAGARNPEGPILCPEYSPTFHAFFFGDPCGNHLEVCCRTVS